MDDGRDAFAGFLLSPLQRRLWQRLEAGGERACRTVIDLEVEGPAETDRLRAALETVAGRHTILGTLFRHLPGLADPVQGRAGGAAMATSVHDLTGLSPAGRESALAALDREAGEAPFDLASGPTCRAWIVRREAGSTLLRLALPALSADPASGGVLLAEVAAAFGGLPPAEEEPLQYVQFAAWLAETAGAADDGENPAREHWVRRQAGPPPALPFLRPVPGRTPFAPESVPVPLKEAEGGAVMAAAEGLGVTAEAFLFAAWTLLLARLGGQGELELGYVAAGRTFAELDAMPGLFARTVPVAGRVAPEEPFAHLAERAAAELAAAERWLDGFPLPPHAETGAETVEIASFELLRLPDPVAAGGAVFSLARAAGEVDRARLKLRARQGGGGLELDLLFDPVALDGAYARALAGSLAALLRDAAARPEAPVSSLELLDPGERARLRAVQTGAAAEPPAGSADRAFFAIAAGNPGRIAVEQGEVRLTYGELAARAAALAAHLGGRGAGPEEVVGFFLDRSPEMVVAVLGILAAGAAYLPLDPAHPAERLSQALRDSGARLLVSRRDLAARLPEWPGEAVWLDDLAAAEPPAVPPAGTGWSERDPDCLAYVLYTSGSTGAPKGVAVPHRGLANYLGWAVAAYGVTEGAGVPLHSSPAFDLSLTALLAPLLAGRTVVLAPREGETPAAEALAEVLQRRGGFSFVKLTPGHARVLARQLSSEELGRAARGLVLGGEALLAADVAPWRQAAPALRIWNEYGPTETVVGCALYEMGESPYEGDSLPIGRPIAGARLHALDCGFREVPVGVAGELYIGGAGVARGYLGRPDLTAERFVPDPFGGEPGGRLYRSGDVVRLQPDGLLAFLGRNDHQVKIRGFRVEPDEVAAVLGRHPGVAEAVVVARPDGAGSPRLVAYFVPRREDGAMALEAPEAGELRAWLAGRLPDFMVPAAFVALPALPLAANGKVDRRALPEPEGARPAGSGGYVAPRFVEEEILAAIWARVLGVEKVGIDDDYFALGGDSIRTIPLVSAAREKGLEISLSQVFAERTIRRLAASLLAAGIAAAPRPPATEPFGLVAPEDRRLLPEGLEDAYPLGHLQGGMLFHRESEPEAAVYHDVFSYHLRGPAIDEAAVSAAIAAAVERHPTLRTTFDLTRYSEPLQLVHRRGIAELAFHDLRQLSPEEQAALPAVLVEEEKRRGWDPARLPLIRFAVHLWSDETFQFTISIFHPIIDGWSDATLLTEIALSYGALVAGEAVPGTPPATRHRDFVVLERQALASEETRRFWRERLAGAPVLALPYEGGRDGGETHRPAEWHRVPVDDELSQSLKRLARRAAVPQKSVLLAAHLRALSILGGDADVLTCATSSGRPETADGERVLGLFLNSMPFRLRLSGGTWMELIRQAFDAEREALPFRRFPMGEAQRLWFGGRRLSDTSFYFTHYHVFQELDRLPELELLGRTFHEATSFPLVANFSVDAFTDRVGLDLTVDPNLFTPDQVELFRAVYGGVLARMVEEPDGRYDGCDFLPEAARRQVLEWGGKGGPEAAPVLARFAARVAASPEAPAVEGEGETLSFAELDRRSEALALRLRRAGVGPESLVALLLERSPALLVSLLAVWKAGGVYLPLEPSAPPARLERILADAAPRVVLCRPERAAHLPAGLAAASLDPEAPAEPATDEAGPLPGTVSPEQLAYVIYTSGSTGTPKGVAVDHRGLAAYLDTAVRRYVGEEVGGALVHSSVAFDLTVTGLFAPLLAGRPVVLVPKGPGVDALAAALTTRAGSPAAGGLAFVKLTPSHARLLGLVLEGTPAALAAGAARTLVVGGEALDGEDLATWRRFAPATRIVNEYGPTEAVVGCTAHEAAAGDLAPGPVPIGRPLEHARVLVLDAFLHPLPPGVVGEICAGGPALARGYLGRPAETAGRFVPDPTAADAGGAGGRLYRTGDLGRWLPDGMLEYLGRRDGQIKLRGYRIEPGEVEAAVAAHPGVREAAVLLCGGGDSARLVAWLVPSPEGPPASEELRAFLAERLPEVMIPAAFVPVPSLPLTPNGKLDAAALPDPEAAPRLAAGVPFAAPRTDTEEILAGIWTRVLGVPRAGIDDDYFALGGDSIRSLQVVAQARERGLELSLADLFESRTLRRLSAVLAERQAAGTGSDEAAWVPFSLLSADDLERLPAGLEDAYPLCRLQAGMLYHREERPDAALYHDVLRFHLRMPLDLALLAEAGARLIARHPVLRTTFALDGAGEPLQLVWERGHLPVQLLDLTALPAARQDEAVALWVEAEQRRGFDLASLPLLRLAVHLRGADTFTLGVSFHHAILDGWSDATQLTELALSYLAQTRGEPEPFSPPSVRYRDFVELERRALTSEESRRFWQERLSGARPALLPRWQAPAAPSRLATGGRGILDQPVEIGEELSQALHRAALAAAVPLKSVLAAAHARVLEAWCGGGEGDLLTCMTSSGRPEGKDGQRVLGLFVNSLPLRLPAARARTWRELVQALFEAERETLPHRRFPLAEMQSWHPGRKLAETSFYFTHYHVFGELSRFPELEVLGFEAYEETSFVLVANFHLDALTSRVVCHLTCDRIEIPAGQAEALAGSYARALAALAADLDAPWDAGGDLLTAEERSRTPPLPAAEPLAGREGAVRTAPYAAPSTEVERRLAGIWAELFGLPRVGVRDDFRELGGHSLLATRAAVRIRRDFGVPLTLAELALSPTIETLAPRIEAALWAKQGALAGVAEGMEEGEI